MFFLKKNLAEDCSEKRTDAYDDTNVRSVCIIDGNVFKKLIKDYSGKACKGKKNIVASCNFFQAGTKNPQTYISRNKSVKKNFQRCKIAQQIFCADKGNAPEEYTGSSKQITKNFFITKTHERDYSIKICILPPDFCILPKSILRPQSS